MVSVYLVQLEMPTPLNLPKGIIYLIRNKVNGKCYIGQTIRSFHGRYSGGRWWDKTQSDALRSDVKVFGVKSFEVIVLAHSIPTERLNDLESMYSIEYNSYIPHGYNAQVCGKAHYLRGSSLLANTGPVTLNNPDGNDQLIPDIVQFCNDNGLHKHRIWRILAGKSRIHYGWTRQGDTKKSHIKASTYIVYDMQGVRHTIENLRKFCRDRGLRYGAMASMIQGDNYQSQGYALSTAAFSLARIRHVVVLTKGSERVVIEDGHESVKCGFARCSLYRALKAGRKTIKGWTIESAVRQPV